MKVTVIGAGNVGATCANVLALKEIASEVVLLDVAEGVAEGKAMDIAQSMPSLGFDTVITGVTNDYSKTANSEVVVITSGMPRKPGMSREDLVSINVSIVESVVSNALVHSPNAIFIIVTNPLDTMTLVALNASGLPKNRVIGMGGVLDSARFKYFLSQKLDKPINEIHGMVIGGHGDTTMIPLRDLATYKGLSINELLTEDEFSEVIGDTMVGGATFNKLGKWSYNSTITTGNLRTAASASYEAFANQDQEAKKKFIGFSAIILSFIGGALLGTFFSTSLEYKAIWIASGIILITTILYYKTREQEGTEEPIEVKEQN